MNISVAVVVVVYPAPSERWGRGGRPWSPRMNISRDESWRILKKAKPTTRSRDES